MTYPGDDRGLPDATTQLDPNHSHFLLANSAEWGGETSLLFDVLDVLSETQPTAAILAGGGTVALDEALAAAQRGIPLVVITGTGGIADQLAAARRPKVRRGKRDTLTEVIDEAELVFVALDSDPADLERLLTRFLQPDETLRDAWRTRRSSPMSPRASSTSSAERLRRASSSVPD